MFFFFFLWQFPTNDVFYWWGWCRELWDMFAVPLENKAGNWTDAQSMEIKPNQAAQECAMDPESLLFQYLHEHLG